MRRFRPTLVAGALALALSAGTASAQFTNAYIFGDSLSDGGQYRRTLHDQSRADLARCTSARISVSPRPHRTQGGTNYAYGGAQVTNAPGFPPLPPTNARPCRSRPR